MSERWQTLLTHAGWVLGIVAAVILAIDPQHVAEFAGQHPQWDAVIMAVWAVILAWANKVRGQLAEKRAAEVRKLGSK